MCRSDRQLDKNHQLRQEAKWLNEQLKELDSAEQRIRFVLQYAEEKKCNAVQMTSFGIQSCLMLDLLHKAGGTSKVPVAWVDTGYLPPETYQFAKEMETRYNLNLQVCKGSLSPDQMEAAYGKLWEDNSDESHRLYNTIRKVEPMQTALRELRASFVLTGLRASQTDHRRSLQFANVDGERLKICPVLDWTDDQVTTYFGDMRLPYHPLYFKGYRTVGDWHSSEPYDPSIHRNERDTRFRGRTQECGLHVGITPTTPTTPEQQQLMLSQSYALDTIAANGFVIYGRPSCRFCRAARKLVNGLSKELEPGVPIIDVEVGKSISKEALQAKLGVAIQTVPQVLYKGNYIGGYDDLVEWGNTNYGCDSSFAEILSTIVVD